MNRSDRLRLAYAAMHPERRAQLVERLGSAAAVVEAISAGRVELPDHARDAVRIEASVRSEELRRESIVVLMQGDAAFPKHVAELPDGPDVLFLQGSLPSNPGVALVGTRAATRYGLALARQMGRAVAAAGWAVISGLARGVDGAAHRGTLEGGGVGVAVLGCGIDVCYPAEHRSLRARLVASGGAVVSEYPPGTPPNGWRFPPRNRIISAMAGVAVVVEARVDGGALITARRALEQGREVFAVPGDVDRATSAGCNLLIRDGAHPVLGPEDLVEAVSRVLGAPPREASGRDRGRSSPVLEHLGAVGRHPDELAAALGWSISRVMAEVARLEAEGAVAFEAGAVSATAVSEFR